MGHVPQITGYFGEEKYNISQDLTADERLIAAFLVDILLLLRYNTHAVIEHLVSDKHDTKNVFL